MPQITGGTTEVTVTLDLAALGASLKALGTASLTGTPPVVTFPITSGSKSSTDYVIEHAGSGLEIVGTNPPATLDTQNYEVNTGSKVVNATISNSQTGLFTLGSSGLSNVQLTLTSDAANTLNAAFGLTGQAALTTSTPIGTLTSSPIVK
jgi:hypothetical protein